MGIIDAALDSVGGMLADQWKDVITAGPFDEHAIVVPGVRKSSQNGRGNNRGAEEILSNGSVIFVPENTAAFVFSQSGIEQVITTPGGHEYRNGEATLFDAQDRSEKGIGKILLSQAADRIGFSGMSAEEKRVAFVNLREVRGLKFGTRGPLTYNDLFYGTDLEVYSYGVFSVQVVDPTLFIRNFVPANTASYSFDSPRARTQLLAEFLHSFIAAVNSLSSTYRISQLPSQTNAIAETISSETDNAGTWEERFGLRLVAMAIENIEFSEDSRELVRQFSEKKMGMRAYEGISQQAANVAAQQLIAEGVRNNGLGDAGGMLFGMNLAQSLNPQNVAPTPQPMAAAAVPAPAQPDERPQKSLDDQIEVLKKLKDLLDAGILSQEEFDAKKREILDL